ncbi:hypothetical protein FRC14_001208 [Serendipita sp. 396]|nr:hypothetical protein FRC14_001208 [Serendipita sp. 396]KAG8773328.1 hypothetical protein FRC15_002079 [Serendipita sp. 397]KAG8789972.1 hypothetical protein FRC16_001118 [Serendipita sp. 398]KAG8811360.1 hypothetical protein FRC18_003549 [Serendipita sp. 400]KAG8861019.1 hypothetical protein FRC20_011539 [Serendipita sp. 405]KAG9041795.1 hypothetical protein FS842_002440 [Serendipita sp. 407]
MNALDTAAMKHTVKAPREYLDRCVFVLKLSADLRKLEDSGNRQEISKFVDEAYGYLKQVATPPSKEVKKSSSPLPKTTLDWDQIKQEIGKISHLVPDRDITTELGRAEAKDKSTSGNLASTVRRIKATATHFFSTKEVELLIVGESWGDTILKTINVHEKTQPAALVTAIAFARGKAMVGTALDFYHPKGRASISKVPARWSEDQPTPHSLYVVPSRGYFKFLSTLSLSGEEETLIRNIFKLKATETIYFKKSSGDLLEMERPTDKAIINGDRVSCSRIGLQTKCKQLTYWGEVVREIRKDLDSNWEVKPASNEANTESIIGGNSTTISSDITTAGSNTAVTATNSSNIATRNPVNPNTTAIFPSASPTNATPAATNGPAATNTTTAISNSTITSKSATGIASKSAFTSHTHPNLVPTSSDTTKPVRPATNEEGDMATGSATIIPHVNHSLQGSSRTLSGPSPIPRPVSQQQSPRQSRNVTPGPSNPPKELEKQQGFIKRFMKKIGF